VVPTFVFSKSFVNQRRQTAREVLLVGWLAIPISGLCEEARGQQIAQAGDEFHVRPGQKGKEDNDCPRAHSQATPMSDTDTICHTTDNSIFEPDYAPSPTDDTPWNVFSGRTNIACIGLSSVRVWLPTKTKHLTPRWVSSAQT
jgi:hypothetical protein